MEPLKAFHHQSIDARVWAKEFNRILVSKGNQPYDEGWIISWFANAIMAGMDEQARRTRPAQTEVVWPPKRYCTKHKDNKDLHCTPCAVYETNNSTIDACRQALSSNLSRRVVENRFALIKNEISDCICHVIGIYKQKIPEKVLNDLSNQYADKIAAALKKGEFDK